ncbi:hypothetical protein KDA_62620 [Dictyobacter alpinus]|uniref:HAMP domain-containing protein n=1 Tax=Dictyobacter alpinus TaxID=2014873 RepID=A0A402BH76_9CHLR|nr:hypothetical protein [Dictyobacter alpinus]GCE30778.1 hypothetical protein KDA_62620 [Dictyobacter alpinus]
MDVKRPAGNRRYTKFPGPVPFAAPEQEKKSILSWWYRLVEPDKNSVNINDDPLNRTRIASILLLVSFLTCIAFIPSGLTSTNYHVLPPVLGLMVVTIIAMFLNKFGKVQALGLLLVIAVDAALVSVMLTYPNFELTQNAVPIYDLFVLSIIIAVSFLPVRSVLYIAVFNCSFICLDLFIQPHTPDLHQVLIETSYTILIRPLAIQIIVAFVTYLWVRNATRAIERANQAELVAQLESQMAQQKKELDIGIQILLQTLVEAANGNLNVRAPYSQENMLWQVGSAVNMLISRLQRTALNEQELKKLKSELIRLIHSVRESKRAQSPIYHMPGGTDLDPLISELLGSNLSQTSSSTSTHTIPKRYPNER